MTVILPKLEIVHKLDAPNYDGVILVTWPGQSLIETLHGSLKNILAVDAGLESEIAVFHVPNIAGERLIYAPTGKIDSDYDDVRVFNKTTRQGIHRALKAGVKNPILIVLEKHHIFENSELVTILGALEELYVPFHLRSDLLQKNKKVEHLGIFSLNSQISELVELAQKLEYGRTIARDIGGTDSERMAAPMVQKYVESVFSDTSIKIEVISDSKIFTKHYPLLQAVNRCAEHVERHQARIIKLVYDPSGGNVKKTVMLVGKGVTFDTGGADIKINGAMVGMSRDKCGAAAVAGFMHIVNALQPKNIKVIGVMCMVRNSCGSDSYVPDEIITARSGARVLVVNTDAEGRMAMADALCEMKEMAKKEVNPHLYTIATLTGHAVLAKGEGYTIVMDNGPARKSEHYKHFCNSGTTFGEPVEISVIRKEDINFHRGQTCGVDVVQGNNKPSTQTQRGHQTPAGFLLLASGLIDHGSDSKNPINYTHLDIAGSAGSYPNEATGAPVLALTKTLLLS